MFKWSVLRVDWKHHTHTTVVIVHWCLQFPLEPDWSRAGGCEHCSMVSHRLEMDNRRRLWVDRFGNIKVCRMLLVGRRKILWHGSYR